MILRDEDSRAGTRSPTKQRIGTRAPPAPLPTCITPQPLRHEVRGFPQRGFSYVAVGTDPETWREVRRSRLTRAQDAASTREYRTQVSRIAGLAREVSDRIWDGSASAPRPCFPGTTARARRPEEPPRRRRPARPSALPATAPPKRAGQGQANGCVAGVSGQVTVVVVRQRVQRDMRGDPRQQGRGNGPAPAPYGEPGGDVDPARRQEASSRSGTMRGPRSPPTPRGSPITTTRARGRFLEVVRFQAHNPHDCILISYLQLIAGRLSNSHSHPSLAQRFDPTSGGLPKRECSPELLALQTDEVPVSLHPRATIVLGRCRGGPSFG